MSGIFYSSTFFFFLTKYNFFTVKGFYYCFIELLNINSFNLFFLCIFIMYTSKFYNFFFLFFIFFFFNIIAVKHSLTWIVPPLIIGYNSIHPVIFYVSCISLTFIKPFFEKSIVLKKKNLFLLSSFSLILGGYWGLGNSSWGYFWVNDFIELILFCFCLLYLILIHNTFNLASLLNMLYIGLYFFFLLFLLRYGFIFTRHNFFDLKSIKNSFIALNFFFFLTKQFFISIIFFLSFYQLVIIVAINIFINFNKIFNCQNFLLKYLHFFFLGTIATWFKNKALNFLFFKKKYVYVLSKIFFLKNFVVSKLVYIPITFKFNLYTKIFITYFFKLNVKNFLVYASYFHTIFFITIVIIVLVGIELKLYYEEKAYF